MFSEQELFFLSIQEKEERSKIDWFYSEVYEGRLETEDLQGQLRRKEYDPADVLHVLFDYTFFERVIEGEYDWRIGNDRALKKQCEGYVSKAESVKKEIRDFAGPEGIAKKVSYKQDAGAVNIYRQLLADATDKGKAEELLAKMMRTDMKRCFEASEKTMELYSALADIRHKVETELLSRLISPKQRSRTVFLRAEDFEAPRVPEPVPAGVAVEAVPAELDENEETKLDLRPVIDLENAMLDDVSDDDRP
ncbi:MAG: hypothetical protein JW909_03105 [Planctomycetes bacterium]|nr:hypothetical protein [Planctomycetota bacterium]